MKRKIIKIQMISPIVNYA